MEKLAAASASAWLVQTYSGKKYRSVTELVAERYFSGRRLCSCCARVQPGRYEVVKIAFNAWRTAKPYGPS
ncbi:Uncharacterised protein [Actinobaculum suis]|uniref:Uncharacterized protein n=1 Tax=Actinobaculum suis TaxID=1657 RepID=A0A7Z9C830_9ACTO|nr:Uncharacterised protein [Actinobaculum suis]